MARTKHHDRTHAGTVTPSMRIYNSKRWKVSRQQAMLAAQYVCQQPGCTETLVGPGRCHVHHVKRLQLAPALAYEPLNHQSLCPSHHSRETAQEIAQAKGRLKLKLKLGCDELGRPLDPQHPWNVDKH